jgi:MFS family permease
MGDMGLAAPTEAQSSRLENYFHVHRTLRSYPTSAHRWGLLALTVSASTISFYEFGYASLLPLWLPALHFTAKEFSYFLMFSVVLSAVAAAVGGPLADRHGRVVVIDLCLIATLILTFCNLLMTGFWSFALVRGLMNLSGGLMAGAIGGLTRDMSPRLSRGLAFGVTIAGPSCSQWLWTFIPGMTLPYFQTWQSQIWIMGVIGILLFIPVALWLKDLDPSLRLAIVESESSATAASDVAQANAKIGTARDAYRELLSRWQIWILTLGAVSMVSVPITMHNFGPLMYVQAFTFTPAQAATAVSCFWLSAVMFVPGGYLSDLLQVRKPLTIVISFGLMLALIWWIGTFRHPLSPFGVSMASLLFGSLYHAAWTPWTAFYSEYLEDISPALQATGWSVFHFVYRIWAAFAGLVITEVAQKYGWATWMWVVVFAAGFFVTSLLAVPGYWRRLVLATGTVSASAAHI